MRYTFICEKAKTQAIVSRLDLTESSAKCLSLGFNNLDWLSWDKKPDLSVPPVVYPPPMPMPLAAGDPYAGASGPASMSSLHNEPLLPPQPLPGIYDAQPQPRVDSFRPQPVPMHPMQGTKFLESSSGLSHEYDPTVHHDRPPSVSIHPLMRKLQSFILILARSDTIHECC